MIILLLLSFLAVASSTNCWNDFGCPGTMIAQGDGSACSGGGEPDCDLGICAGSPNGGSVHYTLLNAGQTHSHE